MRRFPFLLAILLSALHSAPVGAEAPPAAPSAATAPAAEPATPEIEGITWERGPEGGDLGKWARIGVPQGFVFADGKETRLLLEKGQNLPSGNEQGFLAPEGLDWSVFFEYEDTGHVSDEEKASLDADAMLKTIREGSDRANEERKKRGWPEMRIVGWETPPRYNEATHNLEWALRGECEGRVIVNHNTRRLGREGVMRITLVASPDELAAVLPKFEEILNGFEFKEGNRYAEYRKGDKLAKYGLSALVVGGGAAALAKAGGFKYLWKVLAAGGIAVAAFVKRIFSKKGDA